MIARLPTPIIEQIGLASGNKSISSLRQTCAEIKRVFPAFPSGAHNDDLAQKVTRTLMKTAPWTAICNAAIHHNGHDRAFRERVSHLLVQRSYGVYYSEVQAQYSNAEWQSLVEKCINSALDAVDPLISTRLQVIMTPEQYASTFYFLWTFSKD